MGAVAGAVAVDAGWVVPLVQSQLAGSRTYQGKLHVDSSQCRSSDRKELTLKTFDDCQPRWAGHI